MSSKPDDQFKELCCLVADNLLTSLAVFSGASETLRAHSPSLDEDERKLLLEMRARHSERLCSSLRLLARGDATKALMTSIGLDGD